MSVAKRKRGDILDHYSEILIEENMLIESFNGKDASLKQFLIDKDWEAMNAYMYDINVICSDIQDKENERIKAYLKLKKQLKLSSGAVWNEVIAAIPENRRDELSRLYYKLKINLQRVKAHTQVIAQFIETKKMLVQEILEEVKPGMNDFYYGRTGRPVQNGSESLLVNAHF